MDLQEVHNIINFYLRKEQAVFLSPEEIDRVINRAQVQLFDEIKPAYGVNQQVHDALLPFKKEQTFVNGTSPAGLLTFNTDYVHLLSVETVVTDDDGTHYISVEPVGEDEVSERRGSQLIPLNVYNPIGLLKAPAAAYGQYRFQIYPAQASAGTIYYLRKPATVEFDYTMVGRVITYAAVTSTQLEWNEPMTEKIIFKALQMCGINTGDITAVQFGQAKAN